MSSGTGHIAAGAAPAAPSSGSMSATTAGTSKQVPRPEDSQPIIIQDRHSSRRYIKGRFLGKGGFAKCYVMTDVETKKIYAGKIVSKATLSK